MDVNCFGKDKIYINWRVLDRYKAHYKTHNLTRNMVDIKVYIPDRNIVMTEHFCYRYFNRSRGSPHSLVRNLLKEGIGHLYNRYYVDNDYRVLVNRQVLHCYMGACVHYMEAAVQNKLLTCCQIGATIIHTHKMEFFIG